MPPKWVAVDREAPFYFTKSRDAYVRSGSKTPYPPGTANYHYEIELVVAIGAPAFQIAREKALDAVFGYACGLDMKRRLDHALARQFFQQRRDMRQHGQFDTFHAASAKLACFVTNLLPKPTPAAFLYTYDSSVFFGNLRLSSFPAKAPPTPSPSPTQPCARSFRRQNQAITSMAQQRASISGSASKARVGRSSIALPAMAVKASPATRSKARLRVSISATILSSVWRRRVKKQSSRCGWAIREEIAAHNPAVGLIGKEGLRQNPGDLRPRERILTIEEVQAVYRATFKMPSPWGELARVLRSCPIEWCTSPRAS